MMTWRPYLRWLAALALPCLLLACSTGGGEKEEEEDGGLIFPGFDTYKPPQDTTNEDSPWVDLDVVSLETPFDLDGVYQDGDLIDVVDDKADVDLTTTKPDGDLEPELDIKEDDEEDTMEEERDADEQVGSESMELMLTRSMISLSPDRSVQQAMIRIKRDVKEKMKSAMWDDDVKRCRML